MMQVSMEEWESAMGPMSCRARLIAEGVFYSWGTTPVLRDLSVSFSQGESVVIAGPSGGGKSTLLKLLTGLLRPCSGRIGVLDPVASWGAPDHHTTWMGQTDLLLPWRSVLSNVLLHIELSGGDLKAAQPLAHQLLERLGLLGVAHVKPYELSQGMRQRVALARTLADARPFILLDEPCAALDPHNRKKALELVAEEQAARGFGLLMISHNLEDAGPVAGRVFQLREGHLWPMT